MKRNNLGMVSVTMVILSSGLLGCAHSAHIRGSVALKHSSEEADVCLGKNEVKAGDKVNLFKNECKYLGGTKKYGGETPSCMKVKIGEGEVTRVLDDHYSTIRVSSSVSFNEGTIVEKR